MKRILIIMALVVGSSLNAAAQIDAIDKFFRKYMDDQDFTTIYISGKMFSLMSHIPNEKEDALIKKQLQDLKGLRILTSSKVNGEQLYREVYDKLDNNGYEELMVVREGNEEFKFLVKESSEAVITELLMLSGQRDEFLLLSMFGIIDLKTIAKIAQQTDIDGLEHLRNLDN